MVTRGGERGQNVYLWTCAANNQNQHWKKVSVGSGAYRLEKRNAPGFSLNGGSGGKNGQSLNLYESTSNSQNLHWTFSTVGTSRKSSLNVAANALKEVEGIYPNPVIDRVTIPLGNTSKAKFNVIDKSGLSVLQGDINSKSNTVNLKGLSPGIYILQVNDGQLVQTKKIIKR